MTEQRVSVDGRTVKLTNLDKVLYPGTGTTKAEVLDYYARISPVLLPHLAARCVTRKRWPHGVGDDSFIEKNAPGGTPSWVRTVSVPTSGSRTGEGPGTIRFPVVDDLATLTWLANLSALELHVHQWWVDAADVPQPPDRLVIDLDPGEPAGLGECAQVALGVAEALAARGLVCLPVTSGSKGLHLYAPLRAEHGVDSSDEATALAKEVADELQVEMKGLVTATMSKARRRGKVFVDWSQNSGSKTTVSPYSLRGRDRPTVAAPVTWNEVAELADDPLAWEQFTLDEVLGRVAESGDLLSDLLGSSRLSG